MRSLWWWSALGGRYAVSWPILLTPVVIAVPTTVLNARGWEMSAANSVLGQLVGVALMVGTLALARMTWLRPDRASLPSPTPVLVTFAAASGMRVVGMGAVFAATGVWDEWPIAVSVIGGGVGQTIVLALGAITVNTLRGGADTLARLRVIRARIDHARGVTIDEVRRLQQAVADDVLASARLLLQTVQSDRDAARVAEAVRKAAVEVVRPASHQLHSGAVIVDQMREPERTVRLRAVVEGVRPLAPAFGPVVYEALVFGAVWGAFGLSVALINVVVAIPLLISANALLQRWWSSQQPKGWLVARLFAWYSLFNLVALIAVIVVTEFLGYSTTDLVIGFGLYPISMVLGSLVLSVVDRQREAEQALSDAVEEDARAMSHVLLMAEDERRRLARVMHGEVQAELTAASARIVTLPAGDSGALSSVIDDLMERLQAVDVSGAADRSQTLAQLWETWSLAIPLDADVAPDAEVMFERSPDLQSRVVPIVSEAITNAVRHGDESGVTVDIYTRGSKVWIEVRNRGFLRGGAAGLGALEIDRYAESWTVTQEGNEVVFAAWVTPGVEPA